MTSELEDQVKNRAYEIWESEGRPSGRELEHWQRAIAELNEVATVQASEAPVLEAPVLEAPVKGRVKDKPKAVAAKSAASTKPKPVRAPAEAKPQRRSTRAQVTLN